MARVLFAAASVQALIAVIALVAGAIDPSFWWETTEMEVRQYRKQRGVEADTSIQQ